MSITVTLTPSEEARLAEEAVRNSLTTEEFAAKVLREHLNRQTVSNVEMVREKLRLWQEKT